MTMDHVDLEDVFVELTEEEPLSETESRDISSETEEEEQSWKLYFDTNYHPISVLWQGIFS